MFSAHRPFKDLEAADITSASVRLSPPDTTIQIVETEELVSYLNEVCFLQKKPLIKNIPGQAVIFTLSLADGSQVEIIAYNPFIIIDGIGYKCKYEPCEALNHYANELMTREPYILSVPSTHRVNLSRTFTTKYPPPTAAHRAGNLKKVSCFFLPKMRW